jgi:hypothetical protein
MNLSDIRDFARETTLLESDDWPNSKILVVINEGINVLSNRFMWPWLTDSAQLSLVADQPNYALTTIDADLNRIEAIIVNGESRRLGEVSAPSAWTQYGGQMPESPLPTHFFLWGGDIHFIPSPTENANNALTVYFYKKPTLLSGDADVPEWDDRFHAVLAYWACARIWEREEDMEKAQYWRAQFDGEVDRMASYYLNRATDAPTVVGLGHSPRARIDDRVHLPILNGA